MEDATPPPDEQLWPLAIAGDEDAFRIVFDRHVDAVITQCTRRVGNRHDAEDLTSSVFLAAWRSGRRARFVEGSLRPWLMVVANNVTSNQVRSTVRRRALLRRIEPVTKVDDIADEVVHGIHRRQEVADLIRCVNRLNAREQEIVALVDFAELSYAQAAAALGVPIGTVRSRLSRTHAKLRTLMNADATAVSSDNHTSGTVR